MTRTIVKCLILAALLLCAASARGAQRFPPPQFESGYTLPTPSHPAAREGLWDIIDAAVLVAALAGASWLAMKKRNRRWIVALMIFSILYFGFWRRGCVCPIGAVGNVTMSLFDPGYALPWVVTAFFLLPPAFTLFFGRSFCGGVCPFGALQDVVLLKPVRIAPWAESGLRMIAWTYLSLAVLFAATGGGLLICRYDPFVSFFRLGTNITLWVLGIVMLLTAVFIGRPYCRFLCPYGLLLRQCGRVSRYHVTVTPDECIHCRLCEDGCPFGVIHSPTAPWPESDLPKDRRRLVLLILLLPVLVVLGGRLGRSAVPHLTERHDRVRMARERMIEEKLSERQIAELMGQIEDVRTRLAFGGMMVGGFLAFIAGGKLIENSIRRVRRDYEPDRAGCFACGRCFEHCPKHREKIAAKGKRLDSVRSLEEVKVSP